MDKQELKRELSLTTLLMFGIGGLIGASIYALSGYLIKESGLFAIAVFILTSMFSLTSALIYAEFSSIIYSAGGGYSYIKSAFSGFLAFLGSWLFYIAYISAASFYMLTLARYLNILYKTDILLFSAFIIILFTIVNLNGVKATGDIEFLLVILKVTILLFFSAIILLKFGVRLNTNNLNNVNLAKIIGLTTVIFISFEGYDIIATTGGEAKNPRKDAPLAIILTIIFGTLIYMLVIVSMLSLIDAHPWILELDEYEMVILKEAEAILDEIGFVIMLFGIILSILSAYNASFYAGTRILFAASKDGFIIKKFLKISDKKVPSSSIVFTSFLILLIAILAYAGIITNLLDVKTLVVQLGMLASFSFALSFALVDIALIVHRRKFKELKRGFKTPLYPITPLVGVGFAIFTLVNLIFRAPITFLMFLLLLGIGKILYILEAKNNANNKRISGTY